MKAVLAVVVAALSAIESVLLAMLWISIFVPPGGGGEFNGLNRLAPALFSVFVLAPLAFVIVLVLVLYYHNPGTHKDFRSLALALIAAIATVPAILLFRGDADRYGTPWHLVINAIILFVSIVVILWRRVTREEDSPLQTSG